VGRVSLGAAWQRPAVVDGDLVRWRAIGRGPPLVLLHGLAGSSRWWARVLPALAARRRVYLVDLPGFGEQRRLHHRFQLERADPGAPHATGAVGLRGRPSGMHPAGEPLRPRPREGHPTRCEAPRGDPAEEWVAAWMTAAGLARADVVGHSMGGYVAARLAATRPERVGRLVLVAPAGLASGRSPWGWLGAALRSAGATAPGVLPLVLADALRSEPRALARAVRALLRADVRPQLAAIRAPTLLVWGARDTLIPAALGPRFQAALPHARLLVLEQAGHNVMVDQPAAFSAVLLDFLQERDGPGSAAAD